MIKRVRSHHQRHLFSVLRSVLQVPTWMLSWRAKALVTVLVVIFGGAYIAETNTLATSGYVINSLQQSIEAKTSDLQKLETKVASFQSMNSIQSRLSTTALVPVDTINYIRVAQSSEVVSR